MTKPAAPVIPQPDPIIRSSDDGDYMVWFILLMFIGAIFMGITAGERNDELNRQSCARNWQHSGLVSKWVEGQGCLIQTAPDQWVREHVVAITPKR